MQDEDVQKDINYKKPSNTKQMNRAQKFELKYGNTKLSNVRKYK